MYFSELTPGPPIMVEKGQYFLGHSLSKDTSNNHIHPNKQ